MQKSWWRVLALGIVACVAVTLVSGCTPVRSEQPTIKQINCKTTVGTDMYCLFASEAIVSATDDLSASLGVTTIHTPYGTGGNVPAGIALYGKYCMIMFRNFDVNNLYFTIWHRYVTPASLTNVIGDAYGNSLSQSRALLE